METVVGLLLMLLGVSQGVETYCDGRQDGAQCYGALGGTVVLQLMESATEIALYRWLNETGEVLRGRKNRTVINIIADRSVFTPSNGTFRINQLSRTDDGEYTLQIFSSAGQETEQRTLQLTIQGVETYCDGRQDGAQCYGALGGTVVLQLMDSATEIALYQWSDKTGTVLRGGKDRSVLNRIADRSVFTPSDGTFRINQLSRTDDGEYTLQIFNSAGQETEQRTLQLTIQAPVSSVSLDSECLSQGEMRVSCSSEGGDSPQYSWTLDGQTLKDTELLSGDSETNNITLRQNILGELVCSVRNHISSVSEVETISTCGFIFIDCTLPNGTYVSQWVLEANNTLCIEPTTASSTEGVETYCDGRQDGAQCYGALGGTVVLQLMDSATEIALYRWSDKTGTVLRGHKNRTVLNRIADRSVFTPSDGTFRINQLSRTDDGEYTLQIFNSAGQETEQRTLQLTIQAPVSSVSLDSECLSQGEMRVSCSSEGGDSPQYSWTLDGQTLTDAQLLSGDSETNNITLRQDVSGELVCSVRNHISSVSEVETISTCGFIFIDCTLPNGTHISQWVLEVNNTLCIEPTPASTTEVHSLLIFGLRAAVVILILSGIAVYFAWKKKK